MSKKKLAVRVLVLLVAVLINIGIICMKFPAKNIDVDVTVESDVSTEFQFFYAEVDSQEGFTIQNSQIVKYEVPDKDTTLTYQIPSNTTMLRLDFASGKSSNIVEKIVLRCGKVERTITSKELCSLMSVNEAKVQEQDGYVKVNANSEDPFITWNASAWNIADVAYQGSLMKSTILKVLACLIIDLMVLYTLINIKKIAMLPIELFQNRKLTLLLQLEEYLF